MKIHEKYLNEAPANKENWAKIDKIRNKFLKDLYSSIKKEFPDWEVKPLTSQSIEKLNQFIKRNLKTN